MNETLEILNTRHSVRSFKEEKIDPQVIRQILDAGLKAASAGNLQPLSIIKIEDPKNAQWFVDIGMQNFIARAPLNLLFCLDFNRLRRWSEHHHAPFVADKSMRHFWVGFQDVIIVAQTIETAANALGIGSVYIGTTVDVMREIKERFNLPKGVIPIVLLTMGYPKADRKVIAPKLSADIVVHDEVYHDPEIAFIESEYHKKYGDDTLELTEERKAHILGIIREVHGEEKALDAETYLKDKSFVERPTRYFSYNYPANVMARDNSRLLKILEDDGLIWVAGKNHPQS